MPRGCAECAAFRPLRSLPDRDVEAGGFCRDENQALPARRRCIRAGIVADVDTRRQVPRTDLLLADPRLAAAERRLGRPLVKAAVARAQQCARDGEIAPEAVADAAVAALPRSAASLTPVINATGILVHTNLGRAPLSPAAIDAITTAAGTCDVEFDLLTGARGRRGSGALAALARAIQAAEAVAVV